MHCVITVITVFICTRFLIVLLLFSYSAIQPQVCNKRSVSVLENLTHYIQRVFSTSPTQSGQARHEKSRHAAHDDVSFCHSTCTFRCRQTDRRTTLSCQSVAASVINLGGSRLSLRQSSCLSFPLAQPLPNILMHKFTLMFNVLQKSACMQSYSPSTKLMLWITGHA